MSQRYKLDGFAETRDALRWVALSAPSLKFGLTLDEVLLALEGGYDSVARRIKDEARLSQLALSRLKMREAIALFKAGDGKRGCQTMQQADELFTSLRRVGGKSVSRQVLGDTEHGANEVDE